VLYRLAIRAWRAVRILREISARRQQDARQTAARQNLLSQGWSQVHVGLAG